MDINIGVLPVLGESFGECPFSGLRTMAINKIHGPDCGCPTIVITIPDNLRIDLDTPGEVVMDSILDKDGANLHILQTAALIANENGESNLEEAVRLLTSWLFESGYASRVRDFVDQLRFHQEPGEVNFSPFRNPGDNNLVN